MEKKIFVLTKDLNFFYIINRELNRLNIKFKILNIGLGYKIPNFPCLILTTSEEIKNLKVPNSKNVIFLPYFKKDPIEKYLIKMLAAIRVGYRKNYSELIFSIDPGTKRIGLVIFLDDYYLNSHTFYENNKLMTEFKNYIKILQNNDTNLIKLIFKFGSGIISLTLELLENFYNTFSNEKLMQVFLIDEYKSSKVKLRYKGKRFSKDEASALILAFREGIEVNQTNYLKIIKPLKGIIKKKEAVNGIISEYNSDNKLPIRKIAEKVLEGELSLKESTEMIKNIEIS